MPKYAMQTAVVTYAVDITMDSVVEFIGGQGLF